MLDNRQHRTAALEIREQLRWKAKEHPSSQATGQGGETKIQPNSFTGLRSQSWELGEAKATTMCEAKCQRRENYIRIIISLRDFAETSSWVFGWVWGNYEAEDRTTGEGQEEKSLEGYLHRAENSSCSHKRWLKSSEGHWARDRSNLCLIASSKVMNVGQKGGRERDGSILKHIVVLKVFLALFIGYFHSKRRKI